jgi:hypothetical protein
VQAAPDLLRPNTIHMYRSGIWKLANICTLLKARRLRRKNKYYYDYDYFVRVYDEGSSFFLVLNFRNRKI